MIPAILAAPAVEGIVGSVVGSAVGSIAGLFSGNGSSASAPSGSSSSFGPILNQISARANASLYAAPSGSMTPQDWSGMSSTDLQTWMQSLTGKHVHAVDLQGRTVSGVVQGCTSANGVPGLNVGGHFVTLSNLNQVSWSPAIR